MWYAHQPSRRARQIIGDGAALLWVAGWAVVAVAAHRVLGAATRPRVGLPGPLHGVARAGDRIVSAAPEGAGPVRLLVLLAALAVFVVPVALLCALWLPRRIRWVRRAAAARDLANSEDGRELLALRALLRPLDEVGRTAEALPETTPGSLAEGWREGDPATLDALAEAELIRLGLRTA
ncbi:hypothetical protein ACN2WE_14480 [Streptomyces sp. cg28]|uniref:hypothetical protein n=1 Tax=unclassified Streptomyces TaxID=2593676 RepID=UPI000DBA74E6|nr:MULTISPECIES: hypothetical protein [unclassified Streptomyces]MYT69681.1 hypothetical protein [Streptomyces sp. SID8367]RAJ70881.1 hypothetical protein K377_07714 [Streptomyces sp. PsTaAH-137]